MQLQLTAVAYGDPRVPARLWAYVQVDPGTGCWTWTGSHYGYQNRYGKAWYKNKTWKASRLFYTLLVRPLEQTEHAHHECRNGSCVNPEHLEALPQEQHWGHGHADKTHCPRGHEYTPENTRTTYTVRSTTGTKSPNRTCRACARERYHEGKNQTKENR